MNLRSLAAAALCARALSPALASAQTTLKISHPFPGSTGNDGDFRDRLVKEFAKRVEEKTGGKLKFEVYPNSFPPRTSSAAA